MSNNPNRACPACAELRFEVAELRAELAKVQERLAALDLAARIGPHARRCSCGRYATRAATVTHPLSGPSMAQLLCDECEPRNVFLDGKGETQIEELPPEQLKLVRKCNASMGPVPS